MKWEKNYVADAAKKNRIVAGFNIFGYEDAQAVIRAAERVGSPVLLMVNRDARAVMAINHWAEMLNSLAESSSVPVGVHLDHCEETRTIIRAIESGFSSVMFDGSHMPITENLKTTKCLAQYAHGKRVLIEAELGTVPYSDMGESEINLTDPEEAFRMQEETEVDWLAVSVGNVHRLTTRKVEIQFKAIKQIEGKCKLPLVIHGASGVRNEDITRLKKTRVGKINYGTVLRKIFGDSLRLEMQKHPLEFDRLRLFHHPVELIEEQAFQIIKHLWKGEN